jgi:hypothetical protein
MMLMRFDPFREIGCITAQVIAVTRVPGTSGRVQRVSSHREADEIPIAEASNPHRIFLNQRGEPRAGRSTTSHQDGEQRPAAIGSPAATTS